MLPASSKRWSRSISLCLSFKTFKGKHKNLSVSTRHNNNVIYIQRLFLHTVIQIILGAQSGSKIWQQMCQIERVRYLLCTFLHLTLIRKRKVPNLCSNEDHRPPPFAVSCHLHLFLPPHLLQACGGVRSILTENVSISRPEASGTARDLLRQLRSCEFSTGLPGLTPHRSSAIWNSTLVEASQHLQIGKSVDLLVGPSITALASLC